MRILILTKNILVEKDIQQKLQLLGHEVFVTTKYLKYYLEKEVNRKETSQFHLWIISKTVSDREADLVFSKYAGQPNNIFREVEEIAEEISPIGNESYSYLKENASITELREAIADAV